MFGGRGGSLTIPEGIPEMASITYDGQSFQIEGRRVWLVSGTLDYVRIPRAAWAARILAAKQAGLNTITTNVVWSVHEPRSNSFNFTGDNDIKQFVELVGAAGMYCILRVGPFVGAGYDLGGLPAWLLGAKDVALRTANTAFLEATSRFLGHLANQVRDLQATSGETGGGPIVLVQCESGWTCGDDHLAHGYLGELDRYLRESGFTVPIINANDLWQGTEGEIDTWTGNTQMLANLRQLAAVRPTKPRIVSSFPVGSPEYWGAPARTGPAMDASLLQRHLAETLAAGAQFNVEPFCGGTNFGFLGGRLGGWSEAFATTSNDQSAPLDEYGRPTALLPALRRVSMFASTFGRVFANLEPKRQGVNLLPDSVFARDGESGKHIGPGHVTVFTPGSQGSVAFVFGHAVKEGKYERPAQLLNADGSILPVYMGDQDVRWCLFDVRLAGRSQLDYCNLSAFALVGRVLVVAGPAGSPARLGINGSPLETDVPMGDELEIIEHENITVVICPDHVLSAVLVSDEGVFFGAADVTITGEPIVHKADVEVTKISTDGVVSQLKYHAPMPPRKVKVQRTVTVPATGKGKNKKPTTQTITEEVMQEGPRSPVILSAMPKVPHAPVIGPWSVAAMDDYIDGSSARFASIVAPTDLAKLGAPYGYGWYKVAFTSRSAGRTDIASPGSGDRLHMYVDGHDAGVMGIGPGATDHGDTHLSLKKKDQMLVVLAENLGRFAGGQHLGEGKGLRSSIFEAVPARGLGKPHMRLAEPVEVLSLKTPLLDVHKTDVTDPSRIVWEWSGKRRHELMIGLNLPAGSAQRGLILLNGKAIAFYDAAGPRALTITLEQMSRGNNVLELAPISGTLSHEKEKDLAELMAATRLLDMHADLCEDGEWSFAKWEIPGEHAFKPFKGAGPDSPAWYRAKFTPQVELPMKLTLEGLSKGQVYVGGKHLGRYFVATGKGKPVGPHTDMFIPASLLHAGTPVEVLIFDEHGFTPKKVGVEWAV